MATTTNYAWETPDDTDLVKDGASAIRTLGSSIDTTTKALNPSTTLGDIEYRSAIANTNTRLGIGTNGQYLSVTGGVPAWADVSAGGITLLSTTTLSGASTTISSINQTYTNLLILIRGVTGNVSDETVSVKPNNADIATYTSQRDSTTGSDRNSSIQLTQFTACRRTGGLNSWSMLINNYSGTTYYKPFNVYGSFENSSVSNTGMDIAGGLTTTSAITSLVVFYGGGNTFSGGQVLIYGVK